jgi:hypothetical protein
VAVSRYQSIMAIALYLSDRKSPPPSRAAERSAASRTSQAQRGDSLRSWSVCLLAAWGLACGAGAAANSAAAQPVTLGIGVAALNGPWKFRTGDDARWAQPDFDDSSWDDLDLTPPPGSHDGDVGLSGYVPGWQARGHKGYTGFAWYRLRVALDAPAHERLTLIGPPYVDSAYQLFVNGRLLGGVGDFSGATPAAYGIHKPRLFPLDPATLPAGNHEPVVVALRVWMGAWGGGGAESGGIHIAPSLGTAPGAQARFEQQWFETFRGYIVDAVEALIFVLLAVMACMLVPFDRGNPAYRWLAAALLLLAAARGNQAVFFWAEIETFHGFELVTVTLLLPVSLAAWTLTWCHWLRLPELRWMRPAVIALTGTYLIAQFLRRSWFYGVFPPWLNGTLTFLVMATRWLFVALLFVILWRAARRSGRERWLTLLAIVLVSIGLFAPELSTLHVPGIWFPFGTGVSRTEYAYGAFDLVLFALLARRLYGLHPPRPTSGLVAAE